MELARTDLSRDHAGTHTYSTGTYVYPRTYVRTVHEYGTSSSYIHVVRTGTLLQPQRRRLVKWTMYVVDDPAVLGLLSQSAAQTGVVGSANFVVVS